MRVHITNVEPEDIAKGEFDFSFDVALLDSIDDPQFIPLLGVALKSFAEMLIAKNHPDPEVF